MPPLTPAPQMQAMMSSMGNMDPGMMQQQMRMMQNMSPADLQRAQQQMDSMDPNTFASQAEHAQKMLSAQQKYVLDVSVGVGVAPVGGRAATATTCTHCLPWDQRWSGWLCHTPNAGSHVCVCCWVVGCRAATC